MKTVKQIEIVPIDNEWQATVWYTDGCGHSDPKNCASVVIAAQRAEYFIATQHWR